MSFENVVQIVSPFAGILLAGVSASLSYAFTKRAQRQADELRLKETFYLKYIESLSKNVVSGSTDESKNVLADAYNQLLLIGSSEVVKKLMEFNKYTSIDNKEQREMNTSNGINMHDALLTELVKSMRGDLYEKKTTKLNENYPTISLSGPPADKG